MSSASRTSRLRRPRITITPEFKYAEEPFTSLTQSSMVLLNGIAEGVGVNDRVGQQVIMRSIEVKVRFWVSWGASADAVTGRFLLVLDRESHAANPSITDILTEDSVRSLKRYSNRKRFKILWDQTVDAVHEVATATDQAYSFKYYKRVEIPMEFNAAGTEYIASINKGALFMVQVDNTSGATDTYLTGYSRVLYSDQ